MKKTYSVNADADADLALADAGEEYFSYILSPDCSSCDASMNAEKNAFAATNDDAFGDRTRTVVSQLYPSATTTPKKRCELKL